MKYFVSAFVTVLGASLISTAAYAADDEPSPAAPAAPAAPTAPAATSEPAPAPVAATPIVTNAAPAPSTDTPPSAAPTPSTKPAPRRFAGSSLYLTNSMTTGTVFRGQTQTYNPTVESSVWLLPRFAINDAFQLRGRMIVSYEYTNNDSTQYKNEPQLSDTTLSLFYRKIPSLFGIKPSVAANVALPTSQLSRTRTMIFTPGATLQLARPFEHVLGGDLMILASAIYSHPIYNAKNPEVADPRPPGAFQCVGGSSCNDLLSGTMNSSDTLAYALLISPEWGKWNPAVYYLGASQWVYSPTEVRNPVDGTPLQSAVNDPTHVRQTHYFSVWLDYNFNSWVTGEVGYWNSRTALGGDGQRGNIFFDRYQDTRVYLAASFQIDNLVKAIQGSNEGEGGVVRAQNTKKPIWSF